MAKNWELIADITIDEEKQSISIIEDITGNPFKLEAVEIFLMSLPGSMESTGNIDVSMTSERVNPVSIGNCATNAESKRYCYGLWKKTGMGLTHIKSMRSSNGNNVFNIIAPFNVSLGVSDEGIKTEEACEGIWIGSHYQNVLSVGTVIRIYGIRI